MCKFFSLVSDGKGKIYYFDWEIRKQIIAGKLNYESDSHTSIADYYGFKGAKEDKLNKYEFNPLTQEFTIDQLNTEDDSECVKKQCLELDFKKVVEPLIIKRIIHPFNDVVPEKVTKKDKLLLKEWDSVWDSVSVWASVRDSVSVMDSVWDFVWVFAGNSVWDSVGDSVWASVRASVWAYHSSFFNIQYKFNFSVCVKLWERGFIPSFDGTTWRLHSGKDAHVVFEITQEELKKLK